MRVTRPMPYTGPSKELQGWRINMIGSEWRSEEQMVEITDSIVAQTPGWHRSLARSLFFRSKLALIYHHDAAGLDHLARDVQRHTPRFKT